MFKKRLSKVNDDSAQIELQLIHYMFSVGRPIPGKLVIVGGVAEQSINDIEISLMVNSFYRVGEETHAVYEPIVSVTVSGFTIKPNEVVEIPFTLNLPTTAPVTSKSTSYSIVSNLDIDDEIDPSDDDHIKIFPGGLLTNFMTAMDRLGLQVFAEGYTGACQLFSFRTSTWLYGVVDEIEFDFDLTGTSNQLTGLFEIRQYTRKHNSDQPDTTDRKGSFIFTREELFSPQTSTDALRDFIEDQLSRMRI